MLVLTRRTEEQLVIGPDVLVTVLAIGGGRVTLGVTAPADIRVDRLEVRRREESSGRQFSDIALPDSI